MKVTQMPPVHAANLVANSGNTANAAWGCPYLWDWSIAVTWPRLEGTKVVALAWLLKKTCQTEVQ